MKPRWDRDSRTLWVGDVLVKRFRQPAKNQETILDAFEEDGWPPHLDDPLPGGDNVDGQERLKYAVRRLNDGQEHRLIRFLMDGTGKGVIWERVDGKN